MNKTLFVKIDNTPVPIDAENEVVLLDCKQINDFCSFAGDALVGDLKDNNGTPFYRLINPVGRLLSDFEKVDKANYDHIITQWLAILGEMLHKGVAHCDEQFTIHFPQQYVDWLLCNENDYYVKIGKCLQSNEGKVYLDADGVSEDIISALHMKIRRFLNDNKDDIEYIVFSNERIGNASYVVKQLKTVLDSYSFLRLEQWEQILQEEFELQRKIDNIEDIKAFWVDGLKVGTTTMEDIPQSNKFEYLDAKLEFRGGILCKLSTYAHTELANIIMSNLFSERKIANDMSYNEIALFLIRQKGFDEARVPEFSKMYSSEHYWFSAGLRKETNSFYCNLSFCMEFGRTETEFKCKDWPGTLNHIEIALK